MWPTFYAVTTSSCHVLYTLSPVACPDMLCLHCRSVYNESNPYLLERDLLIRSNIEPVGELDFQFLSGKVLIGENVTLTFQNLALRNIRRLGGFGLDFFSKLQAHCCQQHHQSRGHDCMWLACC